MYVRPLRSTVSDNWFYLVVDGDSALLVDPIDPGVAVAAARDSGASRFSIVATHWHPDHVGGNDAVAAALGAAVFAPTAADAPEIRRDHTLRGGDLVEVGASRWLVLHVPGHTSDHIALLCESPEDGHGPALLSGDLLFVAGIGNTRLGGDTPTLAATVRRTLCASGADALPDATRFFPGHDYAARNLDFILSVEPDNAEARRRREAVSGVPSAPTLTTLGEERSYNPFLRLDDPTLQARVLGRPDAAPVAPGLDDDATRTFATLRALRDRF
ncbi:MAG: MBL fold metallo-hydrolase [Myxococcales bacterium]|nr:MBL fold metallo-hydrolase [Myxococcales bacterium]